MAFRKKKMFANLAMPEQAQQSFRIDDDGAFVANGMIIGEQGIRIDGQSASSSSSSSFDSLTNQNETNLLSINDLERDGILGAGACSVVHRVRHRATGDVMALKLFNVHEKEKRHQLLSELRALYTAESPFIVSFYGAFYANEQLSLVLEYMDMNSLAEVLKRVGAFPEGAVSAVARKV
jgi:hypothetical protein